MVAGSGFTNAFGSGPIVPANPSYETITLTANVALVWPQETLGGSPYVAAQIDVTSSVVGLKLAMPPGETGSRGAQTLISNVGANDFIVTNVNGVPITTISAGQLWLITLTDNSTPGGTWRGYQIGATMSTAVAGALAGEGLRADGTQLDVFWDSRMVSANGAITHADYGRAVIWNGGAGALQLDTAANLTIGWYAAIANNGTATITLTATAGAPINGAGSLTIAPGNSGIIICTPTGFFTIGALISTLKIQAGGTGSTTADGALTNLGGTSIGKSIFTAPNANAVVSILGLQTSLLSEQTVTSDQTIISGSSGTAFVATSSLIMYLPLTSSLSTQFVIAAYAQNGGITLNPQVSDKINGRVAGQNFIIAQGSAVLLTTDAAGNWWPLFGATQTQLGDYSNTALPEALISSLKPGWALCNGQQRPRTDPLWLATGAVNAAYWVFGNGNGTTTYTLPDKRGRASFGKDDMGGVAANRLTLAVSGLAGNALGASGGSQYAQADTIAIGVSGAITASSAATSNVTDPQHNHSLPGGASQPTGGNNTATTPGSNSGNTLTATALASTGVTVATSVTTTITNGQTITATSALLGGTQNIPPGFIDNVLIYVGAP